MAQDREQGNAYRTNNEHISEVTVIYHSPKYNLNIFRERMPGFRLLKELINFAVLFANEKSCFIFFSCLPRTSPIASLCLSVCPLGKNRLRLEDFHEITFFYDFSNTSFIQNLTRMRGILRLDLCTFTITNSLYYFRNHNGLERNL
jgi:hypothetical protein